MTQSATSVDFDVKVAGTEVPDGDVISFVVERDLGTPDMAMITLRNDLHKYTEKYKPGDTLELLIGKGADQSEKVSVFKGEVVGLDASYRAGGETKLVIRAFHKLHRLTRGRKSKTYQKQSDQDICSAIAGQHGLSAQTGSTPKITHEHVYQHNQTDLEFLRVRAARLGFQVWGDDTKLYFDAPKLDQDSGIELKLADNPGGGGTHFIKSFSARMSNAGVMKKVTVRGWDPIKKQEIVGEESAKSSPLGSSNAASTLGDFGEVATFTVDHPIFSVEEAKAIAKSKLGEASMSFVTAEAECRGHPDYKPAIVVKIVVNKDTATDTFNGKYAVTGVTHMFSQQKGGGQGGYITLLRLARDAVKGS